MSKKTNVWMPLYIADYLADTTRLTTEQHGAYLLLIMDYWRNGALPDDDGALANITRLTMPQWKKHRAVMARLFHIEAGEWRHKRIDSELVAAAANASKHEERAKKAAAARWSKDSKSNAPSNATSTPQAELDQCPSPSPSPKPTTSPSGDFVGERRTHNPDGPVGILVPDDFQPCRKAAATANTLGLVLLLEVERFTAHYQSRSEVRRDLQAWQAQFRKWLLDQQQFNADRDKVTNARTQAAARSGNTRQEATAAACDTLGVGSQYLTGGKTHAQIAD